MKRNIGTGDRNYSAAKALLELLGFDDLESPLGVSIEARGIKPQQTDEQRGYYWLSLKSWGNHLGYSAKESEEILHRHICCVAFGVKETKRIGGMIIEIPEMRSSRLNREEYSVLIETLIREAAEDGFVIERPVRDVA